MGSFGENLRREREMRGISLEEISSSTKINIRFLEAMECDDFASLPGGIFTRSFIRSYANYLGLDAEQVLADYQPGAPKDVELSPLMFASSSNLPRSGRRSFLTPVLLAIVMLAGAYSIFRYAHRAEEAPAIPGSGGQQATPAPETATPAPLGRGSSPSSATAVSQPARSADSVGAGLRSGSAGPGGRQASVNQPQGGLPVPSAASPIADSDMVLQLAATQRVWVSVDADGKTALQRTLNPQDISTVKAKDHFDVMTGNAQGLVLTLNGETLKPLGRAGEVRKVHLTRSSTKPDTP